MQQFDETCDTCRHLLVMKIVNSSGAVVFKVGGVAALGAILRGKGAKTLNHDH